MRTIHGTLEQTSTTRILVVLPHALVRQGLVALLDGTPDMRVVAHTDAPEDGVRLARDFRPDVIIVNLDGLNGSAGTVLGDLKHAAPEARLLVLTEEINYGQVDIALRSGVEGYTLTGISFPELHNAIEQLVRGRAVLHPEAASALAMFSMGRRPSGRTAFPLTPRQCEVLSLMASGLQNKQIARQLGIGSQTVKTHVSRILAALGTASRTEAVALAVREGLVA